MKKAMLLSLTFAVIFMISCSVNKLEDLETTGYSINTDEVNYTIVAFKNSDIEIKDNTIFNSMEYRDLILKFNEDHATEWPKLHVAALAIGQEGNDPTPIMTIRRFEDFGKAEKYAAKLGKYLANKIKCTASSYAITQTNYRNLIRRRDLGEYEQWRSVL